MQLDLNFVAYINPNGPQMKPEFSRCWEWEGHKDKKLGYAKYTKRTPGKGCKSHKAHRYAYEQFIGQIPDGKVLDHVCRYRGCVNPWHTEPVTQLENIMRGASLQAFHAKRTHCKEGHPLVTCPWNHKRRYCPICQRANHRKNAKRRAKERVSISAHTAK